MKTNKIELITGVLVIIFAIIFVLFTMKVTNRNISRDYYTLTAYFENVEGVNIGTKVKIGGIDIGSVNKIFIDENYRPTLELKINKDIKLPIDSNLKVEKKNIL